MLVFFRIFSVLSAILYLGNVTYEPKVVGEGLKVGPESVLSAISDLLKVPLAILVFNINSEQEVEPLTGSKFFFLFIVVYSTETELL